ncbi:toprim domain-containing protein [Paraflavitalea speifideaquila]|uniref:toprim domain-containing protein n=1 Tax=Paraflavitalea speifideaquila TaxID=3076558 RepID=UPI0028EB1ECD|nr:toprim domain-containing protein [Paraflavitalea speifideiaquila]
MKNLWFDHGTGKGGTIIDFCMMSFSETFNQAVVRLENYLSLHQQVPRISQSGDRLFPGQPTQAASAVAGEKKKIRVVSALPLSAAALLRYVDERCVSLDLVRQFCQEVRYERGDRQYYAIGFPNDQGGYELRNPYFKGSWSPKATTFFDHQAKEVAVFEGFFSFLSYQTLNLIWQHSEINYLVLNSLSFVETSKPLMERHRQVNLYLDQDDAGRKRTQQLLNSSLLYKGRSTIYQGYKDLNHWLIHLHQESQSLAHARKIALQIDQARQQNGHSRRQHL